MLFLLKLCLGVVLAAGLGSAVVVPVALAAGGSVSSTNSNADTSTLQASVNVNQCSSPAPSDRQNESVSFGTNGLSEVCGDSGSSSQPSSDSEKENIGKVLQGSWGSLSFSNLGLTSMTDYCDNEQGDQSGYRTLGRGNRETCSGTEYLKLGDSSNTFLKKNKDSSSSSWKLGLCTNDCGEGTGFSSGGISTTQASVKEKQGKWNELKFFKKTGN